MADQPLPATVQELTDELGARLGMESHVATDYVLDKLADIGYVNVAPADPVKEADASQILAVAEFKKMDSY